MRAAVILLLVFALALPGAAVAQSEALLDDAQRAAIQEFYQKQAQQAAEAERSGKAEQQKQTDKTKNGAKTSGKAPGKKKVEKPKKPTAPKAPEKGQGKDKSKDKHKTNGKTADKAKPAAQTAQRNLERGRVLPQDLPRRALPKALDSQLGKPAPGTQRVIVGDDVMLIERKTGRILDVMADVAKNLGPSR